MKGLLFFCLLISAAAASGQELDDAATRSLLEKIAALRRGKSIEAEFTETRTLSLMKEPVIESGTLAFEPPDKFLRRTSKGNLSVSDGRTLWMYYPAFQQVEKYAITSPRGPGELFAALTRIFQLENLESQFHVTATRDGEGYLLTLEPRGAMLRRMIRMVTLRLDAGLGLRSSRITAANGDVTEAVYSGEKFVAPGTIDFSFTPPKDAEIISPGG